MQNRVVGNVMATKLMQRLFKAKVLKLEPGNIYFFRGYQSLHANEPCLPSSLRATALYQFATPREQRIDGVHPARPQVARGQKARACLDQSRN